MERYKKIIMENSWHQFIYGYNVEQRHQFLKDLEQDYPIVVEENAPMAIYLEKYGLPKIDLELNKMECIQINGVSREYLKFLIAHRVLTRSIEFLGLQELDKRMTNLLSFANRCLINKKSSSLQNITDLVIALEQSIDMYLKGYLNYHEHSFKINDVAISYMDIEGFIKKVKQGLNNNAYFGIIIDKRHDISSFSIKAINSLVGSRITANLSMKIALEPSEWTTYSDANGQMIQDPHDYSTIQLDDSMKVHVNKLKKF